MSGGHVATAIVVVFTTAIFPPLGIFVAFIAGLVLAVKALNRRERRKLDRLHAARMRQFYVRAADQQAPITNPGWRL